jgi:DNA-binding XRE family transcriptional regulator
VTHLGEMLALYRAARRWTVRDLAPKVGISPATLSRIERGHAMDAATLLRLWSWLLESRDVDGGAVDEPEPVQPSKHGDTTV